MRITSKGQVTIPAAIRERAGLQPGAEVDFILDGQTVRIVRAAGSRKPGRGDRAIRALQGTATAGMSTDEIMALTRSVEE